MDSFRRLESQSKRHKKSDDLRFSDEATSWGIKKPNMLDELEIYESLAPENVIGIGRESIEPNLQQLANMSPIARNALVTSNEDYEGFRLPASFLNNPLDNLMLSQID